MHTALCAWSIYTDYGGFPTHDEWYEIAANRIGRTVVPYPAVVSRASSALETPVNAIETGDYTAARVDLYCQFG